MPRKNNKFLYGWKILVNYGGGWEYEVFETTFKDARNQLRAYRENAPQYPVRAVRGRETNNDYVPKD